MIDTSPVLAGFIMSLNDRWDTDSQQQLQSFAPRIVGTRDGQDKARVYLAIDWLIRTYTPTWLDLAGLIVTATALRNLSPVVDPVSVHAAESIVRECQGRTATAREAAAWTNGVSVGAITWSIARDAVKNDGADVARDIVWASGKNFSAWDVTWAASKITAGDAAWAVAWNAYDKGDDRTAIDALKPTVIALQVSALDLLDRMIDPSTEQVTQ